MPVPTRGGSARRPCEVFANFARNLASGFYALPQVKTKHGSKAYEKSRHRNDNHDISASPSLARACCSIGNDSMASARGNESKKAKENVRRDCPRRFAAAQAVIEQRRFPDLPYSRFPNSAGREVALEVGLETCAAAVRRRDLTHSLSLSFVASCHR